MVITNCEKCSKNLNYHQKKIKDQKMNLQTSEIDFAEIKSFRDLPRMRAMTINTDSTNFMVNLNPKKSP